MLTRRGFIIAGGGTLAAVSLASVAQAGFSPEAATQAVYSQGRAPTFVAGVSAIVLSADFTTTLATFEGLLTATSAAPLTLVLDAADTVLFEIAQSRVAPPVSPRAVVTA